MISQQISSAAIIAALGYTPAIANTVTISNGTVSLPGMALAADTSTGFYNVESGSPSRGGRVLGWAQFGQLLLTGTARQDASGGNNAWFNFGDGQAIPDVAIDTYVATLSARTTSLAGASATFVGFNIGSSVLNLSNGITYTQHQAMIEVDKIDLTMLSGSATVALAGALRVRAPVPHDGVTQTRSYSLWVIPPVPVGTGATGTWYGHYHPAGNTTASTVFGLWFEEAPSGAAIGSKEGQDLKFTAGATGTTTSHVILNARTAGGQIKFQNAGLDAFRVDGSGSQQNYPSLSSNNTITWTAQSATGATDVSMAWTLRGAGSFGFNTGGPSSTVEQFRVAHNPGATARVQVAGGTTSVFIAAEPASGSGNVDINFVPKNAGLVVSSGLMSTPASTTSRASLRIAHGTAPSSPVNGDMWTTTAGLFVQINGVTKTVTLT